MVELHAPIAAEPPYAIDDGLVGGRRPEGLGVAVVGLAVRLKTVVIGALLLRFETLGWSGTATADRDTAMAGRDTENARRYTNTDSDRSEETPGGR